MSDRLLLALVACLSLVAVLVGAVAYGLAKGAA